MVAAVASTAHLAPAVRAEHERWDGEGYPDGLAGASIPLASRVILVCDAFHAMTSKRPYRGPLPEAIARRELRENAGAQFDPAVVEALEAALDAGFAPRASNRDLYTGAASPAPLLTARQREILAFVAGGYTTDEIAGELFISPDTAATHVRNAMQRLGARTRAHAVAVAMRAGELLEGPERGGPG